VKKNPQNKIFYYWLSESGLHRLAQDASLRQYIGAKV
jgi:hypothetical protein